MKMTWFMDGTRPPIESSRQSCQSINTSSFFVAGYSTFNHFSVKFKSLLSLSFQNFPTAIIVNDLGTYWTEQQKQWLSFCRLSHLYSPKSQIQPIRRQLDMITLEHLEAQHILTCARHRIIPFSHTRKITRRTKYTPTNLIQKVRKQSNLTANWQADIIPANSPKVRQVISNSQRYIKKSAIRSVRLRANVELQQQHWTAASSNHSTESREVKIEFVECVAENDE